MTRSISCLVLGIAMLTATTQAQPASKDAESNVSATTSSPVAYVYVSASVGSSSRFQIYGFSAATNGRLAAVSGSPFYADESYLVVNGKYLFGADLNGTHVDSFLIDPDGALKYLKSANVTLPNNGGGVGPLFLDHTGATLYSFDYAALQGNNTYEAYNIVKSTGALTYIDEAGDGEYIDGSLSFIGNNVYAYNATCYHFGASMTGFKRASNGAITQLNIPQVWPQGTSSFGYCPETVAADPTNHVAMAVAQCDGYGCPLTTTQLAVYTANTTNGNLATTSTYKNMPYTKVGNINAIQMAPSGKLLAVAGSSGLQVFHFNAANPITTYTAPLTTASITETFWDNANHLYAIGGTTGAWKLWVWTITPTGWSVAPGSPYAIPGEALGNIIVQPLPL